MRLRDLADLRAGRPVVGKTAYKARVRQLMKTKRAQGVASRVVKGFRKTCKEVLRKKGAAARS